MGGMLPEEINCPTCGASIDVCLGCWGCKTNEEAQAKANAEGYECAECGMKKHMERMFADPVTHYLVKNLEYDPLDREGY
jgi:hypothetical protein